MLSKRDIVSETKTKIIRKAAKKVQNSRLGIQSFRTMNFES